jgi:hypothetical protein
MSTRSRRTEEPTEKFDREYLLRIAREADARAREAEATPGSLPRPATIDIVVDLDAHDDEHDEEQTLASPEPARSSSVQHHPELDGVPYLAVEREELPGFRLDKTSERVLAAIDGDSTVAEILQRVRVPRGQALEAIRAMLLRGVLDLHHEEDRRALTREG